MESNHFHLSIMRDVSLLEMADYLNSHCSDYHKRSMSQPLPVKCFFPRDKTRYIHRLIHGYPNGPYCLTKFASARHKNGQELGVQENRLRLADLMLISSQPSLRYKGNLREEVAGTLWSFASCGQEDERDSCDRFKKIGDGVDGAYYIFLVPCSIL